MFSKKELAHIIIPLLIEQALAVTIGMIDSVMVASAGEAAVSGVSLVDTVNLLLIYVFTALSAGGSVVLSQFMGKKDYDAVRESAKQLIWVVFLLSFLLGLFAVMCRVPILKLIFGKTPDDVMRNAIVYFLYTAMSYPFLGIYNACAAFFRAMGDTKTSMTTSVIMNLINVFGNALLIFVFHMGAAGAAIATLFSRIVGASIMLLLVHDKRRLVCVENLLSWRPDFAVIRRICGIGIPNGLENSMFQFGRVLTQSLISSFGTAQIAANAVTNSLTSLQYIPGTAMGLSMITVVGRCVGAGEKEQAKKYAIKLLKIAYCAIFLISLILCVFSKRLIGLYNLSEEAAGICVILLLYHSVCVSTIWPIAFTLPNSFRAASDVRYTMILSITSMWILRIGMSFVLGKYCGLGIYGVWISMTCDWVFRAIMFGTRYIRGTWLTKYKEIGKTV